MSDVLIQFDLPADPLNANDQDGSAMAKRSSYARKRLWQDAGYYGAVAAFPGKGISDRAMPPCDVFISIPVPGERRRDPHNWMPTVKAVIDGIRRAGIWPDDNSEWVTTHEPDLRPVPPDTVRRERVYVRLVPREPT